MAFARQVNTRVKKGMGIAQAKVWQGQSESERVRERRGEMREEDQRREMRRDERRDRVSLF